MGKQKKPPPIIYDSALLLWSENFGENQWGHMGGLPGDPGISSKSSPLIALVCFSSASLPCSTAIQDVVWMFSLPYLFSPSSSFALTNVDVLCGSVPQPCLWSYWVHVVSGSFLSRTEKNNRSFSPVASRAPSQLCSAIGQVLRVRRQSESWLPTSTPSCTPTPEPAESVQSVWTRVFVEPIPLAGTRTFWILFPVVAGPERLDSSFYLFSQPKEICSDVAKLWWEISAVVPGLLD